LRVFKRVSEESLHNVFSIITLDNRVIKIVVLNLQEFSTLHIARVKACVDTQVPLVCEELGDKGPITRSVGWMEHGDRIKIIHIQESRNGAAVLVTLNVDGHIPELA
jgi:hypothetical protein